MGKAIDIIGRTFGKLTVIRNAGRTKSRNYLVECKCECGKRVIVQKGNLMAGVTKSCGCLRSEMIKQKNTIHGYASRQNIRPTYHSWIGMKNRCNNINTKDYRLYGLRGITICEQWKNSFKNFLEDMGEKPEGLSIERIDNDKDYSPENCKWATPTEQARNSRQNKHITYHGETKCLIEWAECLGIKYGTLQTRLYRNPNIERAFTKP